MSDLEGNGRPGPAVYMAAFSAWCMLFDVLGSKSYSVFFCRGLLGETLLPSN